jgi:hypothetical protein
MSSVGRSPQNTSQGDAYFVNISSLDPSSHVLDACGNSVEVSGVDYRNLYPPGAFFLRDMGKTIRVPGQTIGATWTGHARTLRKVQLVGTNPTHNFPVTNGFTNYNEGVSGVQDARTGPLPTGYATFYIDLADRGENAARFARLSVQ